MNKTLVQNCDDLYTAKQAQAMDQHAIKELHIPSFVLMQKAGQASWLQAQLRWPDVNTLVVFCGPGNNGGDGWVLAEAAAKASMNVWVFATKPTTQDAKQARSSALKTLYPEQVLALDINAFTPIQAKLCTNPKTVLFVDAIFGIGLNKAPTEPYATIITMINQMQGPILALDIPTGIDATTGRALGIHILAQITITFIVRKRGLYRDEGKAAAGEILLERLDLPKTLPSQTLNALAQKQQPNSNHSHCPFQVMRDHTTTLNFIQRSAHSHKGNFGTLVCVGGDEGMGGAIIIAAESAVRFGAGKVYVASSTAHNSIAITRCPSAASGDYLFGGNVGVDLALNT